MEKRNGRKYLFLTIFSIHTFVTQITANYLSSIGNWKKKLKPCIKSPKEKNNKTVAKEPTESHLINHKIQLKLFRSLIWISRGDKTASFYPRGVSTKRAGSCRIENDYLVIVIFDGLWGPPFENKKPWFSRHIRMIKAGLSTIVDTRVKPVICAHDALFRSQRRCFAITNRRNGRIFETLQREN